MLTNSSKTFPECSITDKISERRTVLLIDRKKEEEKNVIQKKCAESNLLGKNDDRLIRVNLVDQYP